MNALFIVILFVYLLWFIVFCLTIFKPYQLGRWRIPLYRMGWITRWSMFTRGRRTSDLQYFVEYRDQLTESSFSDWSEFSTLSQRPIHFLSNPDFQRNKLCQKCVKNLLIMHQKGVKNLVDSPHFEYLSAVVNQAGGNKQSRVRQVRVAIGRVDESPEIIVQSDLAQLWR